MIPIKIHCGCGQKYAFDTEPVNGQMPAPIACPACGIDGTVTANQLITQTLAAQPPPGLAIARPAAVAARMDAPPPPAPPPPARVVAQAPRKPAREFNLGLGILGALIGALVGIGAMYGFYAWAGFRFPL